jgi:hypothetical protein
MLRKLIRLCFVWLLLWPSGVLAQDAESLRFTLADLGEKDIVVNTIFDQATVHFLLPEGKRIDGGVLKLHLAHGEQLRPDRSDVTIALNDEPAINLPLMTDNLSTTLEIPLPIAALRPGNNQLQFRFNQRLQATGCSDLGDNNLWTQIFADTTIELDGTDVPLSLDLARYPEPFTTLSTLAGSPHISIVLPERPTSTELTAAAQIAAALGQAAQWQDPPIRAATIDRLDEARANDHLIVIDTAWRNPLAQQALAGVTLQTSPRNPQRVMLIMSGADAAELSRAAALLTTQSARAQLSGTHVNPAEVAAQPVPQRPARVTFAAAGFADRWVNGIGWHDLYYPIDVPYDWKVTNDAKIDLRFAHARGLANESMMSASVNGKQVAAVHLTRGNADDGRQTIQISPRDVHPGRNWLHLKFDLRLPTEDCNFRYLEEAWASISAASSMLDLAHLDSEPPLDVRYWPSPLTTPNDLGASLFALSAQPTASDLSALVVLAAKLGTFSTADGLRPRATTDQAWRDDMRPGDHIIAIGLPETNKVLQQVDAQLPQPLTRSNGVIQPSSGRELQPDEQTNSAGYVQVLHAPWSAENTLITISAPDETIMQRTLAALPVLGQRLTQRGNVAIVNSEGLTGLILGELAGALSPAARHAMALIMLGLVVVVAIAGAWSFRRRRTAARRQESEHEDD